MNWVFCALALLVCFVGVGSAFSVDLEVKERAGVDRVSEPVTSGIPISKEEGITSIHVLRILDDTSNEIPAQFRVLSRYNGLVSDTTKPIRVVLVDFQITINANQIKTVTLCDGGSGTTAGNDLASDEVGHINISTGDMIMVINETFSNLFDIVKIDSDGDGQVDDIIVDSPQTDGFMMVYNDELYSSYNGTPIVTIEENGPIRSVVKIKGNFKNASGGILTPPDLGTSNGNGGAADTPIGYTIRLNVYKNKSFVKAHVTFENENQGWGVPSISDAIQNIWVNSSYTKTTLVMNTNKNTSINGYTTSITTPDDMKLYQDEVSDGTQTLYDWNYTLQKNGAVVQNGTKYNSYYSVSDGNHGVMVGNRWFWQNFPKSIRFEDDAIYFDVLPQQQVAHRVLGGIWKTHEILYDFYTNVSKDHNTTLATIKKRLVARPTSEYIAGSEFMFVIAPNTFNVSHTFGGGESLQYVIDCQKDAYLAKFNNSYIRNPSYNNTIPSHRENRIMRLNDTIYTNWYGWLAFGDLSREWNLGYNSQHYGWDYIALAGYLRFEDYDLFEMGEEMATHKADIIIMHDPNTSPGSYDYEYHGGQRYEDDGLISYYDAYQNTGNLPRSTSHFWTKGVTLQYFLTGEERYRDSAIHTYTHIHRVKNYPAANGNAVRVQARAIEGLLNGYMMTGNSTYLDSAYETYTDRLLNKECDGAGAGTSNCSCNTTSDCSWIESFFWGTGVDTGYDMILIEPMIKLELILNESGRHDDAENVSSFMMRWGNWSRYTLFPSWRTGTPGAYTGSNYFAYTLKKAWASNESDDVFHNWYNTGEAHYDAIDHEYGYLYPDLFAYMYLKTGDDDWLDMGRTIFKDFYLYDGLNTVQPITTTTTDIRGLTTASAAFKQGKILSKPSYYLHTEWEHSLGDTFSPSRRNAYYNASLPISNVVNTTGYFLWNRSITTSDNVCNYNFEVII